MFKKAAKEVIGQEKYSEIIAIVKDKARCQE